MRSMIGMRAKAICDGKEMMGMISSIKGDLIQFTISTNETLMVPLDNVEITKASEEDLKVGIELILQW